MLRLLIRLLVLISYVNLAQGQTNLFTYTQFNDKDGLGDNIIYSICQDPKGIVWVGTQSGLSRFDGKHFYNFRRTRSENSLMNNTVYALCLDQKGGIWGGTGNGIFHFDPARNLFTNYQTPSGTYRSLIYNIQCDKKGQVYATQNHCILTLVPGKKQFEILTRLTENQSEIMPYSVMRNNFLLDEGNHCLWIGLKKGLGRYDLKTHQLRDHRNAGSDSLYQPCQVSTLAKSASGAIWFSDYTHHRLIAFHPGHQTRLKMISLDVIGQHGSIATLLIDKQERMWMSCSSYQNFVIEQEPSLKVTKLKSVEGNSSTMSSDYFWSAFEDRYGSIWFGTLNGISVCNTLAPVYQPQHIRTIIPALDTLTMSGVVENPFNGFWYLMVESNGFYLYRPQNKSAQFVAFSSFQSDAGTFRPGRLNQILFDSLKTYFITNQGMWEQSHNGGPIKPCKHPANQVPDFRIQQAVFGDSLDYFTNGQKLLLWNKRNAQMQWIDRIKDSSDQQNTYAFRKLLWKPGHPLYWMNNIKFLGTLDARGQTRTINLLNDEASETGAYLADAEMDALGHIWVANKGVGLYRYDPELRKVRYWTELDGLAEKDIHVLRIDQQGQVWGLYWNKLFMFNPNENSFVNIRLPYGAANFNYLNFLCLRKDGVMMAGVGNEIFEVKMQNLNRIPEFSKPSLSVISFSGKNFFDVENSKLILTHKENTLRIQYGLLVDPKAFPHTFEYMLEGSEKTWTAVEYANEIIYNNLAPGDYTFRLRAVKKNSQWRSEERVFHFTIESPLVKRPWFIGLVLLLFTTFLFLFYRYRMREREKMLSLETKAEQLEKEKAQVMYDSLKQQLNPHFLFNSLTSLSGLIQLNAQQAGVFLEQMSGIYRYILKNAEQESVPLEKELEFARLYIELQQTRFPKGLEVSMQVPAEFHQRYIAPVTIQNLIENAIKHNIIDPESPLRIDIFTEGGYIVVRNNLQRKSKVETSNKKGLNQLKSLYQFLSEQPVLIEESLNYFCIKIPLI